MIWARRHVMRFIRHYMPPIPPDVSKKWHNRLTVAYITLSFWTFVYAIYIVKQTNPELKKLQPGDSGTSVLLPLFPLIILTSSQRGQAAGHDQSHHRPHLVRRRQI